MTGGEWAKVIIGLSFLGLLALFGLYRAGVIVRNTTRKVFWGWSKDSVGQSWACSRCKGVVEASDLECPWCGIVFEQQTAALEPEPVGSTLRSRNTVETWRCGKCKSTAQVSDTACASCGAPFTCFFLPGEGLRTFPISQIHQLTRPAPSSSRSLDSQDLTVTPVRPKPRTARQQHRSLARDRTIHDRPRRGKRLTRDDHDVPSGLRYKVFNRDGHKCLSCGRSPSRHGVVLHADHIVPHSKGGKTEYGNLQTLCEDCNLGKGNRFDRDLRRN